MSTPMHDIPEHFMIPVDIDGQGPIQWQAPDYPRWACWCGSEIRVKFNNGNGAVVCADSYTMLQEGFPPGFFERGKPRD